MKKMRVLWFSNSPANADEYFSNELKGSGGWLKTLDISLQSNVELHVAFFYPQQIKPFRYKDTTYFPICLSRKFKDRILKRLTGRINDTAAIQNCLSIIEEVNPDIIHLHGTENVFGKIVTRTKVPVVVSIQGILTVISLKYLAGLEEKYLNIKNYNTNSLKGLLYPWSYRVQFEEFRNKSKDEIGNFQHFKHIIGRTKWDKRVTRVLSPKSMYYHNDEILRDSFYLAEWKPLLKEKLIIHSTLSVDFYKGFETICMAVNLLNQLELSFEWRVAGIKENDLIVRIIKEKLKVQFPLKGLSLMDRLNEQDIVNSLLQSSLYVATSHIDNSPNGLCEALLLGLPCISTFVGGTGSLITDGEDGVLVQDGDPWVLVGAILELYSNFHIAINYGIKARARALQRHSKDNIVKELIEIYAKVINSEN